MKIPTPVITLIVGLALAVSLLVSSMSAVSGEKTARAQASATAAANTVTVPSGTGSASTGSSAGASATAASPAASASGSGFVIPPHANYVGEVQGNLGSVAIVVHDTFAVAYFCNGKTQ